MEKLDSEGFRDALRKGLGRAVMHVKRSSMSEIQDDLLYACLNCVCYDADSEFYREEWLLEMIQLTDNPAFFRDQILARLPDVEDFDRAAQLTRLASLFAQNGDIEAKNKLYQQLDTGFGSVAEEEVVELDGLKGLIKIAERDGDTSALETPFFLDEIWAEFGREEVIGALVETGLPNAKIEALLKEQDLYAQMDNCRLPKKVELLTCEEVLEVVESDNEIGLAHLGMIRHASITAQDLQVLQKRFVDETRPLQLTKHLRFFEKFKSVEWHPKFLELAYSDNRKISNAAIRLLSNWQRPDIRQLAVELLESPTFETRQLWLLKNNYEDGDAALIEKKLQEPSSNSNCGLSCLIHDLFTVIRFNPVKEFAGVLEWIYEMSSCSCCRRTAVERLIEIGQISQTILNECVYDANETTREHALKLLQ